MNPPKMYTMEQLAEMALSDPTRVDLDRNNDILILVEGRPEAEYWIEADRIDTPEKCIVWLLHLAEKNWGTSSVLSKVARLASKAHGFKLPWGC